MRKSRFKWFFRILAVILFAAASVTLALSLRTVQNIGYGTDVWKDVIRGRSYLESAQYQDQAASKIYEALDMMARSSRLEKGGEYDPGKIIRLRDYLADRTVYESVPESEKTKGLCYRLGDLYQWSLKGADFNADILYEAYKPLFYESIQHYANDADEEYNVLKSQIQDSMRILQREVAEYQGLKKNWSVSAVNTRYALWDMGDGNICTNIPELQKQDITQEELEAYFKGLGSYYIFDSRSTNVSQQNVGDYYSYNTHSALTDLHAHLTGEYQVYVGIDTAFPAADGLAAEEREYEEAKETLSSRLAPIAASAAVLAVLLLIVLWMMTERVGYYIDAVLSHTNVVVRICIFFAAYELGRFLLGRILGNGPSGELVMLLYKLAVLLVLVWEGVQRKQLLEGVQAIAAGNGETKIPTEKLFRDNLKMAEAVNSLGEGLKSAVEEQVKSEQMKADLITNVSHDLKTPLTSIINYVDLMKREQIDNPRVRGYLEVLDQKSQRLKQLTDDLVEASRASSGNVALDIQKIDLKELLMQTSGEFEERFAARGLKLMTSYPAGSLYVEADGRRLWRIIENLFRNVEKYAMPHTRVYLDAEKNGQTVSVSMKNISEDPLNITAEELTERFVRGDESRTTEGSGLGLSIAKDLTELQNGTFDIYLDGDLFKVTISFPGASAGEQA